MAAGLSFFGDQWFGGLQVSPREVGATLALPPFAQTAPSGFVRTHRQHVHLFSPLLSGTLFL